jgi:hypothetical protein
VTVVDGREGIVSDVDQTPARLRGFIIQSVQALTSARGFDEALPGQITVLADVIMIAFIVFIYFFIIFSISVRLVSTDATDHTPNLFLSSSV